MEGLAQSALDALEVKGYDSPKVESRKNKLLSKIQSKEYKLVAGILLKDLVAGILLKDTERDDKIFSYRYGWCMVTSAFDPEVEVVLMDLDDRVIGTNEVNDPIVKLQKNNSQIN